VPLVFCFQTLHHLEDLKKAFGEIHRVLIRGGTFYFAEEPLRGKLQLGLWRHRRKINFIEVILKKTMLLHFLGFGGKEEVETGVLENMMKMKDWEKLLDFFSTGFVRIKTLHWISTLKISNNKYLDRPKLLTLLVGGSVEGRLQKRDFKIEKVNKDSHFICPDCKSLMKGENEIYLYKGQFICKNCGQDFQFVDDILIYFQTKTKSALGVIYCKDHYKTLYCL